MDMSAKTSLSASRQVRLWLGATPWTALAELACRAGYVARGAVYLSIGLGALLAALRLTPHATGAFGALEAWAHWPFGEVLLWLAGLGLAGFTGWRILQSLFDADRQGGSLKALLSRGGQLISALVYGGLTVSAFGLLKALNELREVGDLDSTRDTVETVLALPAGGPLVMGAGLFIVAAGIGNIAQALFARFSRRLDCARNTRLPAAMLGRAGYLARGLAFLPAGGCMLLAGMHARAGEARGLGAALDTLSALPLGHAVLATIALGLIAFGAYALFEARFRPIRLDSAPVRTP